MNTEDHNHCGLDPWMMRIEGRIVGALRSAINAHGPIGHENVGSATKRIMGNLVGISTGLDPADAMEWLDREIRSQ